MLPALKNALKALIALFLLPSLSFALCSADITFSNSATAVTGPTITGLRIPADPGDAVSKSYIDGRFSVFTGLLDTWELTYGTPSPVQAADHPMLSPTEPTTQGTPWFVRPQDKSYPARVLYTRLPTQTDQVPEPTYIDGTTNKSTLYYIETRLQNKDHAFPGSGTEDIGTQWAFEAPPLDASKVYSGCEYYTPQLCKAGVYFRFRDGMTYKNGSWSPWMRVDKSMIDTQLFSTGPTFADRGYLNIEARTDNHLFVNSQKSSLVFKVNALDLPDFNLQLSSATIASTQLFSTSKARLLQYQPKNLVFSSNNVNRVEAGDSKISTGQIFNTSDIPANETFIGTFSEQNKDLIGIRSNYSLKVGAQRPNSVIRFVPNGGIEGVGKVTFEGTNNAMTLSNANIQGTTGLTFENPSKNFSFADGNLQDISNFQSLKTLAGRFSASTVNATNPATMILWRDSPGSATSRGVRLNNSTLQDFRTLEVGDDLVIDHQNITNTKQDLLLTSTTPVNDTPTTNATGLITDQGGISFSSANLKGVKSLQVGQVSFSSPATKAHGIRFEKSSVFTEYKLTNDSKDKGVVFDAEVLIPRGQMEVSDAAKRSNSILLGKDPVSNAHLTILGDRDDPFTESVDSAAIISHDFHELDISGFNRVFLSRANWDNTAISPVANLQDKSISIMNDTLIASSKDPSPTLILHNTTTLPGTDSTAVLDLGGKTFIKYVEDAQKDTDLINSSQFMAEAGKYSPANTFLNAGNNTNYWGKPTGDVNLNKHGFKGVQNPDLESDAITRNTVTDNLIDPPIAYCEGVYNGGDIRAHGSGHANADTLCAATDVELQSKNTAIECSNNNISDTSTNCKNTLALQYPDSNNNQAFEGVTGSDPTTYKIKAKVSGVYLLTVDFQVFDPATGTNVKRTDKNSLVFGVEGFGLMSPANIAPVTHNIPLATRAYSKSNITSNNADSTSYSGSYTLIKRLKAGDLVTVNAGMQSDNSSSKRKIFVGGWDRGGLQYILEASGFAVAPYDWYNSNNDYKYVNFPGFCFNRASICLLNNHTPNVDAHGVFFPGEPTGGIYPLYYYVGVAETSKIPLGIDRSLNADEYGFTASPDDGDPSTAPRILVPLPLPTENRVAISAVCIDLCNMVY